MPRFRPLSMFTPLLLGLLLLLSGVGSNLVEAVEPAKHAAVTPVPRNDDWWQALNKKFLAQAKEGNIDLLFLGDSITQGWNDNAIWKKHYGKRHAANFGIGGDQTQHVLWRVENGDVDGIHPKLAVLMIGTNNAGSNSAEEIADGIKAIVAKLREKLPETKILLLAIFPRGEKPGPVRDKLAQASKLAAEVADGENVRFLDIGPNFLEADGTLSKDVMPDFLHLSEKGYQIWADSIEEPVSEMLGEKVPVNQ
jgi:lysophospholipase L1-like esterase